MPEIKKQFTGGKMNKDVDERLVPNGEYRHAMNIQVTTSEGSEVGTIQNVLGNSSVCVNKVPEGSFTVGSISDEKNDALYWLVSGQSYDASEITSNNSDWTNNVTMSDSIWRHTSSGCEAVFVDNFAVSQQNLSDENSNQLTNISPTTLAAIEQGWTVQGVNSDSTSSNISTVNSIGGDSQGYEYGFGYEAVTGINTVNYHVGWGWYNIIGSKILIPFLPNFIGLTAPLQQVTGNVVYIEDHTGNIQDLVGASIEFGDMLQDWPGPYEITAAQQVTLTSTSQFPIIVTKLTLDNPLPIATTFPLSQPTPSSVTYTPPFSGNLGVTNTSSIPGFGDPIPAKISIQISTTNYIANGNLHFNPSELNVTDLAVGDALGFNSGFLIGGNYCVEEINPPFSTTNTTLGNGPNSISVSNCTTGVLADGFQVGSQDIYGTPQPTGGLMFLGADSTVWLNDDLDLSDGYEALVFTGPRTLNFNHGELVTGINIVDDMLFWTDNKTEPKKINIPRSVEGTHASGIFHTRLINSAQGITFSSNILAREEHITVIRKAPTKPPTLASLVSNREYDGTGLATDVLFNSSTGSIPQLLEPTDSLTINIRRYNDALPTFLAGDIILLNNEVSGQYPPEIYEVRAVVNSISTLIDTVPVPSGTTVVDNDGNPITEIDVEYYSASITILSISPETSNLVSDFYVSVEKQGAKLFERKFPRFAYRYKYKDGEYSSIGPFSEVAFVPGGFGYHPTEAYNKGMINNLRSLTLKDFIPYKIPKDVVQVDLLYKDEASPNIYLVKSITPQDPAWSQVGSGVGAFGSYDITTENIYAVLPSNQGLRLWDNVPRLALAQEVTGNRVVYANYLQGYNLQTLPAVAASLNPRVLFNGGYVGAKSLKSLRTYNVGVVYGDKYGRETPVFANSESNYIHPKSSASHSSFLKAKVITAHPSWATYYKFYVKETSNEYYNLALGRTYDAKDGNIWLAFPSIDRNKVDEDTYLILKKGLENEEVLDVEAKYKIVAIENEAPDYIKTNFTTLARPVANPNTTTNSVFGGGGAANTAKEPRVGVESFYIDYKVWGQDAQATYILSMPDLETLWNEKGSSELWVDFIGTISGSAIASQKYLITDVTLHEEEGAPASAANGGTDRKVYEVFISTPLKYEDDWISNTPNRTIEETKYRPVIYKKEIINKPEFDGRFFVKIKNDDIAVKYLTPIEVTDINYKVAVSADVYYLRDSKAKQTGTDDVGGSSVTGEVSDIAGINSDDLTFKVHAGGTSKDKSDFEELLKFGGDKRRSGWFIDQMAYAGWQSPDTSSVSGAYTNNTYSYLASSQIYITPGNGNTIVGDYGNGFSRGAQWQKGISWEEDNDLPNSIRHELVLSYSGIDFLSEEQLLLSSDDGFWSEPTSQSWEVGSNANSYEEDQAQFVSKIKAGSKFRMGGDLNKTYTITSFTKRRVYNHRATLPDPYLNGPQMHHGNQSWSKRHWWRDWTKLANNRRLAFTIVYTIDGGDLNNDLYLNSDVAGANATTAANFQFIEPFDTDEVVPISRNPAIFETEPKEDLDLDIYYEASGRIPTSITSGDGDMLIPVGATMRIPSAVADLFPSGITVAGWGATTESALDPNLYTFNHSVLKIQSGILAPDYTALLEASYSPSSSSYPLTFDNPDGSVSYVTVIEAYPYINFASASATAVQTGFVVEQVNEVGLGWFNCWSFGNGVESNRIGDTFNKPFLLNGAKASTTLDKKYEEEKRKYGLIYSGIYNSTSGVNSLNQFIAAEKITKDINPTYGSIQKLHSGWGQSGDLIALCEDRVLKILADKDALFNADGNPQLISTNNVLGQAIPYSGGYGISKNPESFASEAYRIYFTDRVRGAVMRLSMDGLTPISDHGMKDWFKDNLKLNNTLQGSYDDKKDEYNLTLRTNDRVVTGSSDLLQTTVSFREDVKGWVSFKSFTPENAISCANEYYSFKDGDLWLHHVEQFKNNGLEKGRNTFYNAYRKSSFTVILNDAPGSVKSFNTINYEGTQSRVKQELTDNGYHNLSIKKGWWVDSIFTNKESGTIPEFIEKEGKWFNYIRGKAIQHNGQKVFVKPNGDSTFDQDSFSTQGFGALKIAGINVTPQGCTDTSAFNYDEDAIINDGSCVDVVLGCTEPTSPAYEEELAANTDDGSCRWYGCTLTYTLNPTEFPDEAYAYLNGANIFDDNTCIGVVYGCTDGSVDSLGNLMYVNYDDNATVDDGNCVDVELGCTKQTAYNSTPTANTDDNSCVWYGCTEPLATNYGLFNGVNTSIWPLESVGYGGFGAGQQPIESGGTIFTQAQIDSATCQGGGCTDPPASNYDATAPFDDGTCQYCDTFAVAMEIVSTTPGSSNGSITTVVTGGTAPYSYSWSAATSAFTASTEDVSDLGYDAYTVNVTDVTGCTTSHTDIVQEYSYTPGCTDSTASNYDVSADIDDGSCIINGCTDSTALNYDASANVDDGNCIECAYGCMQPQGSINYDPLATCDDGCLPYIFGCTDSLAGNYDILANTDDNTCTYNCPALDSYILTVNIAAGSAVSVAATYDISGTIYSQNLDPGGLPVGLTVSRVITGSDNNGNTTTLYTTYVQFQYGPFNNSAGWSSGGPNKNKNAVGLTPSQVEGLTDITLESVLETTDEACTVSRSDTYTVGCTDPLASNYDANFDIPDPTQCTY